MRKISTLISAALLVAMPMLANNYTTPGTKLAYTFEKLSGITGSGVTKATDGSYAVMDTINIALGDTLRMDNNAVVKMGNKAIVYIEGYGDLAPADTATVTRLDDAALPYGFYYHSDTAAGAIKNITFQYVGIKWGSVIGMQLSHCTFDSYNGKLSSAATVNFAKTNDGNVIENCRFMNSATGGAIAGGANVMNGLVIRNNYFYHNNAANSLRPQLNLTVGGDYDIVVEGNTLIGAQLSKVGGIAISNLLGIKGTNKVTVKDNVVQDHSYGMTYTGGLNGVIEGNTFLNNKYIANPLYGGSGISCSDSNGTQTTVIKGNHIEGNCWGITVIGCKDVNIGKIDDITAADYNPGGNTFKDNGNGGVLYDLYNNSANTVYAQGNTWNVAVQDSVSISKVIYDIADKSGLGEVIFMPRPTSGIQGVNTTAKAYYDAVAEEVKLAEPSMVAVYNAAGMEVAEARNASSVDLSSLAKGMYIVRVISPKASTLKIMR